MLIYKYIKLISALIILVFNFSNFTNAQGDLFIPHSGYSLMLQQKKDLLFSVGAFNIKSPSYKTLQTQIGYSPIKHLGISTFHSRYNYIGWGSKNNQHITGLHLGTYYTFKYQSRRAKKRTLEREADYHKIHFNFSSGYAIGRLKNTYPGATGLNGIKSADSFLTLQLQKIYLQGGIHFILFDCLEVSGIYKHGKVDYYKGILDGNNFGRDVNNIQKILSDNNSSFRELTIKAEAKGEYIGCYIQSTIGENIDLRDIVLTGDMGLTFELGQIIEHFLTKKNKSSKGSDDSLF